MASVLSSFAGSVASETSERPKRRIFCPDFGDGDDTVYITNISTYLSLHIRTYVYNIIYVIFSIYIYAQYIHILYIYSFTTYLCISHKLHLISSPRFWRDGLWQFAPLLLGHLLVDLQLAPLVFFG